MTESEYQQLVDAIFKRLEAALDEHDDVVDYERAAGGVMELEFEDGSNMVVNQQAAVQEIWVAAKSGAGGKLQAYTPQYPLRPAEFPEPPPFATNAVVLASGTNYHLMINRSGNLIAWGRNSLTNAPPNPTNLIPVAACPNYALAVTGEGAPPRILGVRPIAYRDRISVGSPLPLFVRAVGAQPLRYEWLADRVPVRNTDTQFPQISAVPGTDQAEYQVRISNAFGSVTSGPSSK